MFFFHSKLPLILTAFTCPILFGVSTVKLWRLFLYNNQFRLLFWWIRELMTWKHVIGFAPNKEHNVKRGCDVTRAGLTSAAVRSSPGCKLLLSVDELMLSHGLSLGCNKLTLSTPPQGVADSKGHGGWDVFMVPATHRHTIYLQATRRNQQAYLFMAGLVLSGSSSASSAPSLAAEHAAAAASCLLPCAMYSNFSISCSFSVSEAISFRPRVISIFSIFDSISTSLLISITAVLDNASMMETSCVWKEKTADMARGVSVRTSRCTRTSCCTHGLLAFTVKWSYNVLHNKSWTCPQDTRMRVSSKLRQVSWVQCGHLAAGRERRTHTLNYNIDLINQHTCFFMLHYLSVWC